MREIFLDPSGELPVWRSLLYVPVTVPKFVQRAAERGADAIILDLEDGVAPSHKDDARKLVVDAASEVGRLGADVLVRVNRPWRMLVRDLEEALCPEIKGLVLTKVESADHLNAVEEIVSELEIEKGMARGSVGFYALIETAAGWLKAETIARHPRLVALSVGTDDLALSFGMKPDPQNLFFLKQYGIAAARAAGVLPIGLIGSQSEFRNLVKYRAIVEQSRDLGFSGTTCVHPSQVPIANAVFTPPTEAIEGAKRLVAAYEASIAEGVGAFVFEGRMIDRPIAQQAYRLLAIDQHIRNRSASKDA